jgi:hypothetical protein
MRKWTKPAITALVTLTGALTGAIAGGAALAQAYGPPPRPQPMPVVRPPMRPPMMARGQLTLYGMPNYRGRQITLTQNTPNFAHIGFNDQAMSLQTRGRWQICEDSNYRGRCVMVRHDQPTMFGLNRQASSARFLGR